jgi:hypothetical protein
VTPTRWLALATTVSAALALTGCTQTSAGTPLPDDTTTTSSEPDTGTSTTKPSSQRPRDINLEGKDACGLIPQADWPKFDIERPGKPSEHPDFKSPQCYYSSDRAGNVALVVTAGIEIWTEDTFNAEIKDAAPIDGFPTITVASNVSRRTCLAIVDVADGQFLMTTVDPDPSDPNNPERCDLAYQFAESAMKTLVAS